MKHIIVSRPETSGRSEAAIRSSCQDAYELAQRNRAAWELLVALAGPALLLSWVSDGVRAASAASALIGVPLAIASIVMTVVSTIYAGDFFRRLRLLRDRVYLPATSNNDPHDAAGALDLLIEELRSPDRDAKRLRRVYETAVSRLQQLRPKTPLSSLVRYGYYPSRPTITENNVTRTVDHDQSSQDRHWTRMSSAADLLRAFLRTSALVTVRDVDQALAELVPPLRAVLRAHGVETHKIDYMPSVKPAAPAPPGADDVALLPATAVLPPSPEPDDELTPAQDRLNASATLAVSSIRTLELSFRAAEEDLFVGDDLETGRRLIGQHVPSLVRAYIVAHDASQGEERDQIRAEFAQSLGVIRDALAGIMRRHAQEARRRMETETRFIQQRHGDGPLGPVADGGKADA